MRHMAGSSTGQHMQGKRRVTAFLAVVALFCCFGAEQLRVPPALAAPNLDLQGGNTRITSDADYNTISGVGELTIRGASVHANEIKGSIQFFGSGAVLSPRPRSTSVPFTSKTALFMPTAFSSPRQLATWS